MGLNIVNVVAEIEAAGWMASDPKDAGTPPIPHPNEVQLLDWEAFQNDQMWEELFNPDREFVADVEEMLGSGPPEGPSRAAAIQRRVDVCAWYQPIHYFGLGREEHRCEKSR